MAPPTVPGRQALQGIWSRCPTSAPAFQARAPGMGALLVTRVSSGVRPKLPGLLKGFGTGGASIAVMLYPREVAQAADISRCINSGTIRTENPLSLNMVIGTMLFSVLQVLWQVVFLIWHVYGICFNIKTDEWVMSNFPSFGLFLHQLQVAFSFAVSYT